MRRIDRRSFLRLSGALSAGTLLAACGARGGDRSAVAPVPDPGRKSRLRLGYFPNITHVQAQAGLQLGAFADALGPNVTLDMSRSFNAGPAAMEALLAGAIDATYVGPSPAINAFAQTGGKELRIVAGATSGGAMLVVRRDAGIAQPGDFARRKIASPQLGNTQDVALRSWLKANGLAAKDQGGNVTVLAIANADALTLLRKGDIDAAWAPEPWATRLVQETGGRVFLDERSLWPDGRFVTTHLVVRTSYLAANPEVVQKLVGAHVDATVWANANPAEARRLVNRNILEVTGAALPEAVIEAAWENQEVTYDPIASSLKKDVDDAYALGYLDRKPDLSRIYDLTGLNRALDDLAAPLVKGL
jgi:NitT/TauT family transport system substrate-binding protein